MKLIVAQVYEDSQTALAAFSEFTAILTQWSEFVTLDLKIDKHNLEVEYGVHLVKYYSLRNWQNAAACRWHFVNFNFPLTKELVGLKLAKERIMFDFLKE